MDSFTDPLALATSIAWLAGGFVSGMCAIGAAMVAVPAMAFLLPMHDCVLVSCLTLPFMNLATSAIHLRWCRWRALLPMLAGCLPGSLAGFWLLRALPEQTLRLAVGLALLAFPFWNRAKPGQARGESVPAALAAGFASGMLRTSCSFGGPPAAAYGVYAGWPPREYLGTLGAYLLGTGAVAWAFQGGGGMYSPAVLRLACHSVPAAVAGVLLAWPLAARISAQAMRRWTSAAIACGGLACVWKAFG